MLTKAEAVAALERSLRAHAVEAGMGACWNSRGIRSTGQR